MLHRLIAFKKDEHTYIIDSRTDYKWDYHFRSLPLAMEELINSLNVNIISIHTYRGQDGKQLIAWYSSEE